MFTFTKVTDTSWTLKYIQVSFVFKFLQHTHTHTNTHTHTHTQTSKQTHTHTHKHTNTNTHTHTHTHKYPLRCISNLQNRLRFSFFLYRKKLRCLYSFLMRHPLCTTTLLDAQIEFLLFTFITPLILIYFYSKTSQMHPCIKSFYFWKWHSTCFGRSFRPSSGVHDCTYSNRHMSNRYCYCLLASKQHYLFDIRMLLYVQSWSPDDGRKDRPKHVQCLFNK